MVLPVRSLLQKWNSDRLNPGVDLRAELEALARNDAELQGFIISGIGSLEIPTLRFSGRVDGVSTDRSPLPWQSRPQDDGTSAGLPGILAAAPGMG